MGLDINGLVSSGVALAYALTEDIQFAVTYTSPTSSGYNPATSGVVEVTQTASPTAIVQEFRTEEIDGEVIRRGDKKALIKAADLAAITKVGLADRITLESVVWQVVGFKLDPTKTLYTFQIRKLN